MPDGLYKNLQFNKRDLIKSKEDERRFKHVSAGARPKGDEEDVDADDFGKYILKGITNKVYFKEKEERAGNIFLSL